MNFKNILKKVMVILLGALFIIQFFRSEKNNSGLAVNDISTQYPVPTYIQNILNVACNDCHSNTTIYPWYAHIQPVAWWLDRHVVEGKSELNFNTFTTYRIHKQYRKLEEIIELVEEDEMPLSSYMLLHGNAKLDDGQKTELIEWARSLRDKIKNTYPSDSLIRPKKQKI